ncbi:hypothetical protein ACLKA6_007985 [Drosophila palustris]
MPCGHGIIYHICLAAYSLNLSWDILLTPVGLRGKRMENVILAGCCCSFETTSQIEVSKMRRKLEKMMRKSDNNSRGVWLRNCHKKKTLAVSMAKVVNVVVVVLVVCMRNSSNLQTCHRLRTEVFHCLAYGLTARHFKMSPGQSTGMPQN